jgi:exopolysaccharide production protein ExoQ
MSTASIRPIRLSKSVRTFDKRLMVPVFVCAYCLIIAPMLIFVFPGPDVMAPRVENQIFWPLITAIALGCLAGQNRPRYTWPPHMVWFAAYLALAGASILWAFKPEISFSRFVTQMMLVTSIVLPSMLAARTADLIRGLYFCFIIGLILNTMLILGGYSRESICAACGPTGSNLKIGYVGYFTFKGELGEFAALAFLFSLHEIIYRGWRRAFGIMAAITSVYLISVSESKGSFGCALIAALLATLVIFISKKTRLAPAIVLLPLPICYVVTSRILGDLVNRISWHIYGNYSLSGRVFIWDFVNSEIAKRPILGWGYRSFWLVGPDSPALTDIGSWVRTMPSSHNGYLETMLDTGYIGLVLFVVFIFTTFNAIGRVADRDAPRGWLLLSIALFLTLLNFLEAGWMHGQDELWLMFLFVVVEAGRAWQPFNRSLGSAGPVVQRRAIVRHPPVLAKADSSNRLLQPQDICT